MTTAIDVCWNVVYRRIEVNEENRKETESQTIGKSKEKESGSNQEEQKEERVRNKWRIYSVCCDENYF